MVLSTPERILRAAYRLYVRGGADAISMRTTARAARLTAPALYKHYPSKDHIIEAICDRGFEVFEGRLAALGCGGSKAGGIMLLLREYAHFALEEPWLFQAMFVEPRARLRRFPDDFASARSSAFERLRRLVEDSARDGAIHCRDSLGVTRDLWAFAHGYVCLYRAGRFGEDADSFWQAFDAGVRRMRAGLTVDADLVNDRSADPLTSTRTS